MRKKEIKVELGKINLIKQRKKREEELLQKESALLAELKELKKKESEK